MTAPSGVVTFLFTDIEGSTRRWEADPEEMRAALAVHDDPELETTVGLLRDAIGSERTSSSTARAQIGAELG